jgi:hypothetical protein
LNIEYWGKNGGVAIDYFRYLRHRLNIKYWGGKLVWGDFGQPYFCAKNAGGHFQNVKKLKKKRQKVQKS